MIALDKQAHFWAGAGIAATATLYTGLPLFGFVVAVLAAAFKEVFDNFGFGTPDKRDFIATVLGGLVVVPLLFI